MRFPQPKAEKGTLKHEDVPSSPREPAAKKLRGATPIVRLGRKPSELEVVWTNSISHHFETIDNHFDGTYGGISMPGFLRWCEMDFVHPQ